MISPDLSKSKKTTKKIRKANVDSKKLWNIFDKEINESSEIECVYDKNNKEFCELCNDKLIIGEDGFLVCISNSCGIIYKNMLDHSAEWRYYGADDNNSNDPTRCGMPVNPLLKESSYGCKVICNGASSYEMRKIRRYTEWQSMPYKEKSQYDEFQKIISMANQSGIPKIIIDDAIRYHKKISEERTFRGLNRDGIISASIYISCRINNNPRTAKEIATIFNLDNTSATKGCKNAVTIINQLETNMELNEKTQFCKTKPISFIERYCSRLQINKDLTKLCQFIALCIEKKNLVPENTPHSIAAGIIYFITQTFKLNISKKDIHVVSEISEVTINKCYKKLEGMKSDLIPKKILDKYNK